MISILINNYNNGTLIQAAVDSALNQTQPADEIIVYDDGSTDHSLDILRAYGNRITLIEGIHDSSLRGLVNAARAHYHAFQASSGDHLYWMDGDDCYLPNHIELYESVWDKNPSFVMIHGSMGMIDEGGNYIQSLYRTDRNSANYRRDIYLYNETDYFYPTSALAFRRDFLEQEYPIDFSDGIDASSDARLSFAAVFAGPIGFVPEDTSLYRYRETSLSFANGYRSQSRIQETIYRTNTFNAIALKKGQPPVRLWLNSRYLLQRARQLFPAWLSKPFVRWKLSRYKKMPFQRTTT